MSLNPNVNKALWVIYLSQCGSSTIRKVITMVQDGWEFVPVFGGAM